jgi:hypothetical protein
VTKNEHEGVCPIVQPMHDRFLSKSGGGSKRWFTIFVESRFPRQASRIWKGGLVCDLEDFDFLHCEPSGHAGVDRVSVAKVTATAGVCVAVIGNTKATKVWTRLGISMECFVLLFGLQRKFPLRGFFSGKRKLCRLGSAL